MFKELVVFLLGFTPWLLFLFLSGYTLASLERSIVLCLLASVIFSFKDLRKGFILQWCTLFYFAACMIAVNFMHCVSIAENMGLISNGFLAGIIWGTLLIGKPFTLQYARAELPKEQWNDPALIQSCRFIAIVWACLMTFSTGLSFIKILKPALFPEWFYFDSSIVIILGGSIFTSLYKKHKRSQRPPVK